MLVTSACNVKIYNVLKALHFFTGTISAVCVSVLLCYVKTCFLNTSIRSLLRLDHLHVFVCTERMNKKKKEEAAEGK